MIEGGRREEAAGPAAKLANSAARFSSGSPGGSTGSAPAPGVILQKKRVSRKRMSTPSTRSQKRMSTYQHRGITRTFRLNDMCPPSGSATASRFTSPQHACP